SARRRRAHVLRERYRRHAERRARRRAVLPRPLRAHPGRRGRPGARRRPGAPPRGGDRGPGHHERAGAPAGRLSRHERRRRQHGTPGPRGGRARGARPRGSRRRPRPLRPPGRPDRRPELQRGALPQRRRIPRRRILRPLPPRRARDRGRDPGRDLRGRVGGCRTARRRRRRRGATLPHGRATWYPGSSMPEPDIAALVPDRAQTDEHLAEERATTDETIRNRDGDPAVLEPERAETDASLDAERERADETIDRVRERLAEERAAHVATKAALSSRDDFLAIVSHDLRNPLSIITLNAAVLRRCDPTADPAQVARLGERIDRAATAMMRLVNDLLDMARIEEGRLQLQRASHDVSALVLELVDTHRPLAATKGITLETDVAPALAADVDAHRLTQALANVLDNALKFSPQGGRIVVAASHASPDLRIAIRD